MRLYLCPFNESCDINGNCIILNYIDHLDLISCLEGVCFKNIVYLG